MRTTAIVTGAVISGLVSAAVAAEVPVDPGKSVSIAGAWTALAQATKTNEVLKCTVTRGASAKPAGKAAKAGDDLGLAFVNGRGEGWSVTVSQRSWTLNPDQDYTATIIIDGGQKFVVEGFAVDPNTFAAHPLDVPSVDKALRKAKAVSILSNPAGVDIRSAPIEAGAEALDWLERCGLRYNLPLQGPNETAVAPRPELSRPLAAAPPPAKAPAGAPPKPKTP